MIFSDVSGCRTLCIFNLIMVVTKKWLAEKYKFLYCFAICVETTTYDDDDDLEYEETFLAQRLRDSLYVQFYGQRGEEGELHSITYVDCYIVLTASAFSSTPIHSNHRLLFSKTYNLLPLELHCNAYETTHEEDVLVARNL